MRGAATFTRFAGRDISGGDIASCNRALASDKLRPEQTLRRAHLLRARAAAYLEIGRMDAALADIEAAEAAAAEYEGNFFFERSMGVSLDLMRAIVLSDAGEREQAIALARRAAEARPYSVQVQQAATVIQDVNIAAGEPKQDIWKQFSQISPDARLVASMRGKNEPDFVAMVAKSGDAPLTFPKAAARFEMTGNNLSEIIGPMLEPYVRAGHLAYAHAALGQNDKALARLAEMRGGLDQLTQGSSDQPSMSRIVELLAPAVIDPVANLVKARIAVSQGDLTRAVALVEGDELRSSPFTKDLYAAFEEQRALQAAPSEATGSSAESAETGLDVAGPKPDGDAPQLPELAISAQRSAENLGRMAGDLLVQPESERGQIDYKQSRTNILGTLLGGAVSMGTSLLGGVQRTDGFRSTENDDGSMKVEYTGGTTSGPVVQEMTLLRAAELAQESGKSHFVIEDRNDYRRFTVSSQYNIEMSRFLSGYKSELKVRLLDSAEDNAHALNAVEVIDALGPIYYGDG